MESRGYFGAQGVPGLPPTAWLTARVVPLPWRMRSTPRAETLLFRGHRPHVSQCLGREDGGESRWVDVEVTPLFVPVFPAFFVLLVFAAPSATNSGAFLTFFP